MNTRYILLLWLIVSLATACKKEVTLPDIPEEGQISFYFGSTAMTSGSLVLIDSHDTTYQPPKNIFYSIYPFYYKTGDRLPVYPTVNTNWMRFMHLSTGEHQLLLIDSDHHPLDSAKIKLDADKPVTVFYTDSIGYYDHLVASDRFIPDTGKIGIRIINLSPFTGPVYLTFNKATLPSIPVTRYLDNTGFQPVDVPGPQTLNIKVFPEGEKVNFLTRSSVDIIPGHAYTLVISGYSNNNPGNYTDPQTGRTVTIQPNFSLSATKTF
ncbi:DUF4397 domain-containing protein [Chitinophaga sp. G-6-1-13]|uniref:DUF4397 domain-containing protein n=1 Tax=Chitinophaga fulva TaxID=2728842 RepID=A0A848GFN3_9BACT|nr:DUF4397 domain-containing protein [Chitinophaga fulva]NML36916.1 DUF4397 domain-containing protein [Chitinophaga fulva]